MRWVRLCGAIGLYGGDVRGFARRSKHAGRRADRWRSWRCSTALRGSMPPRSGGMDRQTLRDWVIRFNEQGPDGLINIPSPGVPPSSAKSTGPSGPGWWRRARSQRCMAWCAGGHGDRIMRLYEEFGISVSDDTIYRALKDMGFSHVRHGRGLQAGPRRDGCVRQIFALRVAEADGARAGHTGRGLVPGRDAGRPERSPPIAGPGRAASPSYPCSTHRIDLPVRCGLPERGTGAALAPPFCKTEAMQLHLDEISAKGHRWRSRNPHPRPGLAGKAPKISTFRPTYRSCRARRVRRSLTPKKASGSSCDRTGRPTASSNPSTISSITPVTPGRCRSISLGKHVHRTP